jgi:hypothetical protein
MKSGRRRLSFLFYWVGVVSAVAAVSLVVLGNTNLAWDAEHAAFPFAWKLGIVSVMAFLIDELGEWASPANEEIESVYAMERAPYEV